MQNRPHIVPAVIAAIMLCVAIFPLPYGYYQWLRWIICGISIFIALQSFSWGKIWPLWFFIPIAILFNPLFPIHLSKEVWQPIDVGCALLFALSVLLLKAPISAETVEQTAGEKQTEPSRVATQTDKQGEERKGSSQEDAKDIVNYCTNCGFKITPDMNFCPQCGRRLEQSKS